MQAEAETHAVAPQAPSKEAEEAERVWVAGWQQTSPLLRARSGHTAVVTGDVIHVIAGVDGKNFLASSEYARIQPDGSLSEWQPGPSLNVERGFVTAVVNGNYVYIVGGGRGEHGHDLLYSVERAEILADGTLGPWVLEKNGMNIGRRCSKVVALGNYIYSFGGFGGILLDTVERAEILPDGSLAEWLMFTERLTLPRYIAGVKRAGDIVYVVGGHHKVKGVGIAEVEWSREDPEEEGFLLPWQQTAPLQTGRYALAVTSHGDYIYAMGGLDGARYLDLTEKAKLNPDGGLSDWQQTTPLYSTREGFTVLTHKDRVYLIGGGNLNGYENTIDYATFNKQGDIGFWGTPDDAHVYQHKRAQANASENELPNEAVIVQNLRTQGYSYLYVQREDGQYAWLAAPFSKLNAGSRIRFPEGVFMSNFYSKELKRNFPAIMFVGQIRKVEGEKTGG
ncbi:MAG: hypothetical protein R8K46_10360 [Mariprofundaceae bacterium]